MVLANYLYIRNKRASSHQYNACSSFSHPQLQLQTATGNDDKHSDTHEPKMGNTWSLLVEVRNDLEKLATCMAHEINSNTLPYVLRQINIVIGKLPEKE